MQKNKFKQLYDYCQSLTVPVSRAEICPKAEEIAGCSKIKVLWIKFEGNHIRGLFIKASNENSGLYKYTGPNAILLADSLKNNKCWTRFIHVKEVMHLFDDANEQTSTQAEFQDLLQEFENRSTVETEQTKSDITAVWMALACLCPETVRLDLINKHNLGLIDKYGIALRLKIPESHVSKLFRPDFKEKIDALLV